MAWHESLNYRLYTGVLFCLLLAQPVFASPKAEEHIRLGDYEAAAKLLQAAAQAGDRASAMRLAGLYRQGKVQGKNQGDALQLYLSGAQAGHVESMYLAARLLERRAGNDDQHSALNWYQQAAQAGHAAAQRRVRRMEQAVARSQPASQSHADHQTDAASCSLAGLTQGKRAELAFHAAVACDNATALFKQLKRSRPSSLKAVDAYGNSALHRAVSLVKPEAVRWLLAAGLAPDQANQQGWTARTMARSSDSRNIQALLGHNTSALPATSRPTDLNNTQFADWSQLAVAAWKGDLEWLQQLANTNQVNHIDATGVSALSRALERKHVQAALLLLQHGAQPSPTSEASWVVGAQSMALLEQYARSSDEHVDLFCAALSAGTSEALNYLATLGTVPQRCGSTPIWYSAVKAASIQLLDNLAAADANFTDTTDEGCSALCVAVRHNQLGVVNWLFEHLPAQTLLRADVEGVSPVMVAAQWASAEVLQALLAAGATLDDSSLSGTTALMFAVQREDAMASKAQVETLLAAGADPNLRNKEGDTALMNAIRKDRFEVGELLVQAGARVRARNDRHVSALDLGEQSRHAARWQRILVGEDNSLWGLISGQN